MEAPNHSHWHTVHEHLPIGEKESIIRAYECLHAHGIMHNNLSFHSIFIGQDSPKIVMQDRVIYNHDFRPRYECYTGKLRNRLLPK